MNNRDEALKTMAHALAEMGYTRDSDPSEVNGPDALAATGAMIKRLIELRDESFLFEFLTESGGWGTNSSMFSILADYMITPVPIYPGLLADHLACRSRWYGERFIPEALELLDSKAEIARDFAIDQDIDEFKRQEDER